MEITNEIKLRIIDAIKADQANYPNGTKHGIALGISKGDYSSIINGNWEKKINQARWINLARKLNVSLSNDIEWKVADTPIYQYITGQLEMCQSNCVSSLFCDKCNIGKTFTAKIYASTHRNAVYVDCSQTNSKKRLIRYLAKEFGVDYKGRLDDVYDDLAFYIKSLDKPLIILDEAGDLKGDSLKVIKSLWNAADKCCAWFMMGANGLKKKINTKVENEAMDFEEIFSRFGDKFNSLIPGDENGRNEFLKLQAAMVAKINAPEGADIMKIVSASGNSLRRVYTEIKKLKTL